MEYRSKHKKQNYKIPRRKQEKLHDIEFDNDLFNVTLKVQVTKKK